MPVEIVRLDNGQGLLVKGHAPLICKDKIETNETLLRPPNELAKLRYLAIDAEKFRIPVLDTRDTDHSRTRQTDREAGSPKFSRCGYHPFPCRFWSWRSAQIETLRARLFKLGARVRQTARCIRIHLATGWPFQELFVATTPPSTPAELNCSSELVSP
jgi:Transposase DDE domain group 1